MTVTIENNNVLKLIEFRGFTISHQWYALGMTSLNWYELVTLEVDGDELDFNSVEDAKRYIEDICDTDHTHCPVREWGTLTR